VVKVVRTRRFVALAALAVIVALAAPPGAAFAAPGPWRIVPAPNLGTGHNHFQEVSCPDTGSCVAVGFNQSTTNGFRQSVAASFSAGTWKLGSVPARGSASNNLWNVTCPTRTRCFAVGFYFDIPSGYYRTLIARYNGSTWTLDASPNRGNVDNYLFGVDCFDTTHCVAVGRNYDPNTQVSRTLVLNFNGATWTVVATPNRASASNLLADVSCGDVTHCVAVGYSVSAVGATVSTLVMGRNQERWGIRVSADRPGSSNVLRDVSCPSATTCVAVGASDPGTTNFDEQSLVQTFSGGVWSLAGSTDRAGYDNHLWGVSCSTETQCVAVGQSQNGDAALPLIQTRSVAGLWPITQPVPFRSGTFNYLYGVSCPTRQCVAVGDYLNVTTGTFRTSILTNSP
jgi:hypothetical protein